jgi:protocatechuate 3,4-dioxygenase, beta subunit
MATAAGDSGRGRNFQPDDGLYEEHEEVPTMHDWISRLLPALVCLLVGSAGAQPLLPTPSDMLGPYYPDILPNDQDSDLVQIRGLANEAAGQRLRLAGRVIEVGGQPVAGARIEIWQTDANGRYIHSQDTSTQARDPFFQGFGWMNTGVDGGYRFRTVAPVAYGSRPPHIHVRVVAPGRPPLVTQLYFPQRVSEPGLPRRMESDRLTRQTMGVDGGEGGELRANFDFVLPPPARN